MHLADFSIGILGESGILASALPVAVGAALATKLRGEDKVVIAFFGDGASNEGACHETMNLASSGSSPSSLSARTTSTPSLPTSAPSSP